MLSVSSERRLGFCITGKFMQCAIGQVGSLSQQSLSKWINNTLEDLASKSSFCNNKKGFELIQV